MHEFAAELVALDPVAARAVGVLDPVTGSPSLQLPATDAEHFAALEAALLARCARVESSPGSLTWLEERCIQAEVAVRLHELRVARPWERAPYWYAEVLGDALTSVNQDRLHEEDHAQLYLDLLEQSVGFLAQGQRNLVAAHVPSRWAEIAESALRGLRGLVAGDLSLLSERLPAFLVAEADRRREVLLIAIDDFTTHCQGLITDGVGEWVVGEETFSGLLRDYHCLDLTAEQVWEHGWASVDAAQVDLVKLAAVLDPDRSWQEQIESLKAERTPADQFLAAYRAEVDTSLQLTLGHDLLTVPDDQSCVVLPLPEFRRAGLPLGEMRTVPPYATELESQFLITSADPDAPPEQVAGHERDNCPAFIRSIVGHETYPGHHLQSVHHVLGTPEESFLRFFRTPLFVEGWGLYVEDILEERVFGASNQALFARRNRLWRSLRLVIDTGMHTGRLTYEQAVDLLMDRTGMDPHMARGEVDRYTRHDNPTYPSTYVLGRDIFQRLHALLAGRVPGGEGRLHDLLLSHGSPPVALLEAVLLEELS
ncbi:MAG: DUF885 family protein [Ornithinimicrobium sp.]|uniref:DUF885 family protein n=1 Tax=Ornithinimicrobium sp. TaxID=1977084 RepID=UPI0026E04BC4|nr:DUF885 family protein [Ornithinimicrobium sp.]MDO5739762.1 DUF885 family protein [Ornithinimicrobium sp.]